MLGTAGFGAFSTAELAGRRSVVSVMKVAAQTPAGSQAMVAQSGDTGKPIVRPEGAYFALSVLILAAGAVVGIVLDDPSKHFTPKDGASVFAGFFIAAQTIERLLEP